MKPDISYILEIDCVRQRDVFVLLSQFCRAQDSQFLRPGELTENSNISILLVTESGDVCIDGIHLSVDHKEDRSYVEFWATTSESGSQCLAQAELVTKLTEVLLAVDGYSLKLDPSDGNIEQLYP